MEREKIAAAINRYVPGAVQASDIILGHKGVARLKDAVGSSARSEIYLNKPFIMEELAKQLGELSPRDIK